MAGLLLFGSPNSAYAVFAEYSTATSTQPTTSIDTTPPTTSAVASSSVTSTGATVAWNTNEASTTQVDWGTTTSYGSSTTLNTTLVTSHSQALSNLTANTLYHYRVKSKDAAGNLGVSGDFTFNTLPPPDTTPPTISATASSNVTGTNAMIAWMTNEKSNSSVNYGTTTSYGSTTPLDPNLVLNHNAALNNLASQTLYHYQVKSCDAANNCQVSGDLTFTTLDIAPPVIFAEAASLGTGTGAMITWMTNEASDTQVDYGTETTYGSTATLNTALVTSHNQELSGLTESTTYHYRVRSRDQAGNLSISGDFTFTTLDITAPVISEVTATDMTTTSAAINWTTNEASNDRVEYCEGENTCKTSAQDTTPLENHSITITDLTAGTTYKYRIISMDQAGNISTSTDMTFTTIPPVTIVSPAIDMTT